MSKQFARVCAVALLSFAGGAQAADAGPDDKAAAALAGSPWKFAVGARYWFSTGNHRKDLYDPFNVAQKNSRLTFGDVSGHSAETFFRIDHLPTNLYLKGYIGGGALASGKLNDEDYPPGVAAYSNTLQVQSGGSITYASVDLGFNAFSGVLPTGNAFTLGPFVGFHHLHERMNGFGCAQIGANSSVCGFVPAFSGPIPNGFDTLDEELVWTSLRAGIAGEIELRPDLRISLEGAWIHSWLAANDYHNLRPNIRGVPEDGEGDGFQLEGQISYDLTPRLSVGLGGRYWRFNAAGKAHWEDTSAANLPPRKTSSASAIGAPTPAAPLITSSERYGGFLQMSYRFGGPNDASVAGLFGPEFGKAEKAPHEWGGLYAGANVGYGFGATGLTRFNPLSASGALILASGFAPFSATSEIGGFEGGGQIGYNIGVGASLIAGVETDLQYANIGGSSANTYAGVAISDKQQLEWFGSARARLGYLLRDDLLVFGTGGFAFGGVNARAGLANLSCASACAPARPAGDFANVATGWAAGAGVEFALAPDVTFKTEWLYLQLGKQAYGVSSYGGASGPQAVAFNLAARSDSSTHIVRAGVNYRFAIGQSSLAAR